MTIVFDEILSEVHTPATAATAGDKVPSEALAPGRPAPQVELQQSMERITIRQLRLLAD